MSTLHSLLSPGYEPGDGRADGAQLVDGQWWHPLFGCDSLQCVVDNARQALARTMSQTPASSNPTAAELAELCQAFKVENKNPDGLLWLVVTALAIWGEPQGQEGKPETPFQVAQQILQHADETGLSPQDWAKAFNKFNQIP